MRVVLRIHRGMVTKNMGPLISVENDVMISPNLHHISLKIFVEIPETEHLRNIAVHTRDLLRFIP